jgi:DegV family protein with EDD domain
MSLLERLRATSGAVFAVSNVAYLQRGGRISHLQYFLARALDLVPIMELKGGPIRLVERVRRTKNVTPRLISLVTERIGERRPSRVAVVHTDAEARAWQLSKEVKGSLNPDELIISELTPVLGIHSGPDALGIAYSSGA